MTKSELKQALKREIGIKWYHSILFPWSTKIHLSDKEYFEADIEKIAEALKSYQPIALEYAEEENDCDNETARLLGHLKRTCFGTLGFAWSKNHSFIIFKSGKFWLIETYGRKAFSYEEGQRDYFKRYKLNTRGVIML